MPLAIILLIIMMIISDTIREYNDAQIQIKELELEIKKTKKEN